jgi:tRNA modification GTPase
MKTIFSLATAPVTSALHVHRISGKDCLNQIIPYLKPHRSFENWKPNFQSKKSIYSFTQEFIDEGMITYFKGPQSYTGEDMIEITTHGNPVISAALQDFFRSLGWEQSQPGEFTLRRILQGKMDLIQAEALHEVIMSSSASGVSLAQKQLQGRLSDSILNLKSEIIKLRAYLEVHIDFEEHDVGAFDGEFLSKELRSIQLKVDLFHKYFEQSQKVIHGFKFLLCGRPNAGKSTVFNALLKEDRAIVTATAGTTRDILREKCLIKGRLFHLMDTAGIRETDDSIENIAIDRSLAEIQSADLIGWFLYGTASKIQEDILYVKKNWPDLKMIFVWTHKDLYRRTTKQPWKSYKGFVGNEKHVFVGKDDYQELRDALCHEFDAQTHTEGESSFIFSERQKNLILKASEALEAHIHEISHIENILPEKTASLLIHIESLLEELLGKVNPEHVYDHIFSTFCIGK